MIHELKTLKKYFVLMANGTKTFELRKNDRGFKIGHKLLLKEYDKDTKLCTGNTLERRITYILQAKRLKISD